MHTENAYEKKERRKLFKIPRRGGVCIHCGAKFGRWMDLNIRHAQSCSRRHKQILAVEEGANMREQEQDKPPSFIFKINDFTKVLCRTPTSEVFYSGGFPWSIRIYALWNDEGDGGYLSIQLETATVPGPPIKKKSVEKRKRRPYLKKVPNNLRYPYGWRRYAKFKLSVIDQIDHNRTIRKDAKHEFDANERCFVFHSFMDLQELLDRNKGYVLNNVCIVHADVDVPCSVDSRPDNSKEVTGYVGLKNQGAMGFVNSLLQTLYHIPIFRKAVYHVPASENDTLSGSFPLALQSIFLNLQFKGTAVVTKHLMGSHGCFMQHDNQGLSRVLFQVLEENVKGTVVEGTIQQLFQGHLVKHIECINADNRYKSSTKKSFYDLELDVKDCRDVYASFDKYVEVKHLEGVDKYYTERHGLQDAREGVLFSDFPPVLQLRLKRFEFNFLDGTMVKINERYKFPLRLDLDRKGRKYLSSCADRTVRNLYTLHSVLAHSGSVHGGHYNVHIRPTLSDQWFEFDDERVIKEDVKRALNMLYGGNEFAQNLLGYGNAYMLVYIRESDKEKIIFNVEEEDIAEPLWMRLKREREEKEQKRQIKARSHRIVRVARCEDIEDQNETDIFFDFVDFATVKTFCIERQMPICLLKEKIAQELDIPVKAQRFWLFSRRKNHTYRLHRPLAPHEEKQSVGKLREINDYLLNGELKLFLDVEVGQDLQPIALRERTKEDILLFFKLYDPIKDELRYIGKLYVKRCGKLAEIMTKLNQMAGFAPDQEIVFYENVYIRSQRSIVRFHIDKERSFCDSELQDGDIVCYYKPLEPLENL